MLAALKRQAYPDDATELGRLAGRRSAAAGAGSTSGSSRAPSRCARSSSRSSRTWRFEATDPQWESRLAGWVEGLLEGEGTLRGLLDATERRYAELGQDQPHAFFLYVDQGEELYVRAEARQRRRFSEVLAAGRLATRACSR